MKFEFVSFSLFLEDISPFCGGLTRLLRGVKFACLSFWLKFEFVSFSLFLVMTSVLRLIVEASLVMTQPQGSSLPESLSFWLKFEFVSFSLFLEDISPFYGATGATCRLSFSQSLVFISRAKEILTGIYNPVSSGCQSTSGLISPSLVVTETEKLRLISLSLSCYSKLRLKLHPLSDCHSNSSYFHSTLIVTQTQTKVDFTPLLIVTQTEVDFTLSGYGHSKLTLILTHFGCQLKLRLISPLSACNSNSDSGYLNPLQLSLSIDITRGFPLVLLLFPLIFLRWFIGWLSLKRIFIRLWFVQFAQ